MSVWRTVRDVFRDPRSQPARDTERQWKQRTDELAKRQHQREQWREGAQRDPYAPPEERQHPNDPPDGGGW